MQGWRLLNRALPWVLAPAWFIAACGGTTERTRDDANANGGAAAGTSKGGSKGGPVGQPTGGTTLLPMPGRGGSGVLIEGGTGGTLTMLPPGLSDTPKTEACAPTETCESVSVGPVFIDPCCTADGCGLRTEFLALLGATFADKCQAKDQPGFVDSACPTSPNTPLPFPSGGQTIMVPLDGFVGCCRQDGKCGVLVDAASSPVLGPISKLGLGCVDSAPFFGGEPAADCGAGVGGAGAGGADAGGAGGAPVSLGGAR